MVREKSRFVKIKNIKKKNLSYGCFKNNQNKSNQKMKPKERDKSILENVQCMRERERKIATVGKKREREREREREGGRETVTKGDVA